MARCSRAATTLESTPPESPSRTSSLPTWARTWAMLSSMMLSGVQSRPQPQMPWTKRSMMRSALAGVGDLRVELEPVEAAVLVGDAGERGVGGLGR